jgi:hypothetical protein
MRGPRRAWILAASALLTIACEALVGITDRQQAVGNDAGPEAGAGDVTAPGDAPVEATVTDDATGSTDTASPPDGPDTTPPPDAGATSDTGSADAADASSRADASVDAADASDAGADTGAADPDLPCNMQPSSLFCADFDSVTSGLAYGWGYSYSSTDAGVAQFDTTDYVSGPASAQFVLAPITGTTSEVQLGTTIGPLSAGVRVAFDIRLDVSTYSSLPQTAVAQVYLRKQAADVAQVNLVVGGGDTSQLQAYVGDAGDNALNVAPPPLGTWVRAVISYTANGTLSLIEGGQLLGTTNIGADPAGTVTLIFGFPYMNSNGTETVKLELDNLVVTGQ